MDSTGSLATLYGVVYGPLYFSALISTGLYGVTCMQTFFYYVHYPSDRLRMKIFVAILWHASIYLGVPRPIPLTIDDRALDTIHEAITISGIYKYIIAGLINPLGILDANPELALQILSETLVSIPVQAFFVYRIYIVSGRNIVAPLLWIIQAIYQTAASILYVAKAFHIVDGKLMVVEAFVLDDGFFTVLVTCSLSLSAAVDVLIAIAMTYILLRIRGTTKFAPTLHILQRLTIFAVNTGTWTALFALLSIILRRVYPSTFLHALPSIPLSSLYCNTLLANLNARDYLRDGETAVDDSQAEKPQVFVASAHQLGFKPASPSPSGSHHCHDSE